MIKCPFKASFIQLLDDDTRSQVNKCDGEQCAIHDPETGACSIATSSTVLETIAIQLTKISTSISSILEEPKTYMKDKNCIGCKDLSPKGVCTRWGLDVLIEGEPLRHSICIRYNGKEVEDV